jgi:hypothetical protein
MLGSSDTSTLRAVHRLLEHYTPDGTLGRFLLGLSALGVSAGLLMGGLLALFGGSLLEFAAGLTSVGLGGGALFVGLVVFWPLYLSLIGNVESPAEYPTSRRRGVKSTDTAGAGLGTTGGSVGSATTRDGSAGDTPAGESPEVILKRRYAAGEIDDAEFERRLERIMTAETDEEWDDGTTRRAARSRRERETEQAGN